MIAFFTTMPKSARIPINPGKLKRNVQYRHAEKYADQRQRHGDQNDRGFDERIELDDHCRDDQNECQAHRRDDRLHRFGVGFVGAAVSYFVAVGKFV